MYAYSKGARGLSV